MLEFDNIRMEGSIKKVFKKQTFYLYCRLSQLGLTATRTWGVLWKKLPNRKIMEIFEIRPKIFHCVLSTINVHFVENWSKTWRKAPLGIFFLNCNLAHSSYHYYGLRLWLKWNDMYRKEISTHNDKMSSLNVLVTFSVWMRIQVFSNPPF